MPSSVYKLRKVVSLFKNCPELNANDNEEVKNLVLFDRTNYNSDEHFQRRDTKRFDKILSENTKP